MRLGVFGGTFNPIHLGHLRIAENIRRLFKLERIYFVVAAEPPHKPAEDIAPLLHRYSMVCLATAGSHQFVPSLVEMDPPVSPFSYDTLRKLASQNGLNTKDLFFIAGGDSLLEVGEWHESIQLLTTYNFIFVVRAGVNPVFPPPGFPPQAISRVRDLTTGNCREMESLVTKECLSRGNRIFLLDIGAPDIAASKIRAKVRAGKQYKRFVPAGVYEYIQKLHLYGER